MNEKLNFNVFFFKNGIFFENCTDCTDFLKNVRNGLKKCTDCTDLFFKIVRIVFRKLYGFLLKMYGFLYGCVQKSFGHPVNGLKQNDGSQVYLVNLNIIEVTTY